MLQRLTESYRVTLPLAALYANSTVERLAEALREGDDHGFRAPMTRLRGGGVETPPLPWRGVIPLEARGALC